MFIFLEGLILHVVCNPVHRCSKQRVKSFIICCCTWIIIYTITEGNVWIIVVQERLNRMFVF